MLELLAFVLPLGVDTFAVAAALGTRQLTSAQRWRLSALFAIFEGGMPLIGLLVGAPVARLLGSAADYLAGVALLAVGAWMFFADDDEYQAGDGLLTARLWPAIALGLSVSLDELVVGFSLGLSHLPIAPVILAIVAQAVIASQIGLAIGRRVSERWRERSERLAGLALAVLGVYLIIARLQAH